MDALALLCNLYGDGPATLKRLRTAGCDTFDALGELEAAELSEILGTSQPAARRFLREARVLLERVELRARDEEERPPLVARRAAPPLPAPTTGFVDLVAPEAGEAASPLIDKVLQTWRERDARGGVEHDVEFTAADEAVTASEAAEEARAVGTPLRPRIVDGLNLGWCERLRSAGVDTLEALTGAEPLSLAQSIGAGLTQLMRVQFLARRVLSERGQVETPEPPDMLKPVGRAWPVTPARTAASTPEAALPSASRPSASELITGPHPDPRRKFSVSEAPFAASSSLASDLDEAEEPPAAPAPPSADEGSGGPFAR